MTNFRQQYLGKLFGIVVYPSFSSVERIKDAVGHNGHICEGLLRNPELNKSKGNKNNRRMLLALVQPREDETHKEALERVRNKGFSHVGIDEQAAFFAEYPHVVAQFNGILALAKEFQRKLSGEAAVPMVEVVNDQRNFSLINTSTQLNRSQAVLVRCPLPKSFGVGRFAGVVFPRNS